MIRAGRRAPQRGTAPYIGVGNERGERVVRAAPCRPTSQAHKETGFEVLAINLTDQERMKDVRKFAAEFQLPFPVLLDGKGRVRKLYAMVGVPTSVFIGSDGVVRLVNPGPITSETLERGLAEILPAR